MAMMPRATTTTSAATAAASSLRKRLCIVRHGQAVHNPRAEVARANGCSMEEFVKIMREDDALDADLTRLGREQARRRSAELMFHNSNKNNNKDNCLPSLDLVVSSPLSRALETADLIHPPPPTAAAATTTTTTPKRVVFEAFREVNGDLLCAKRRSKTELQEKFPAWDFDDLRSEDDDSWTPSHIEKFEDAAKRGYQGLCWLMERDETSILLVSHGGTLWYTMTLHPLVLLRDDRTAEKDATASTNNNNNNNKAVDARFDNCEARQYLLSWGELTGDDDTNDGSQQQQRRRQRPIVLTQLDS